MSVISANSSFQEQGQLLIYNLLANKDMAGITYIELWNGTSPVYRQQLQQDQFSINNNSITVLQLLPINIGLTFDMMILYGGMQQNDNVMTGYQVAVVTYQSSNIKMPSEYMQVLWELNITILS